MMKTIQPEKLNENVFKLLNKDWMLISACTKTYDDEGKVIPGRINTMTANWGGFGVLWNKEVATIYLRPSRYTKEIIDATDTFSLSVLPEKYRTALNYCGSHSGRDEDKFFKSKLDAEIMNGTPYIKQARLVIFCNKLYSQEIDPNCFAESLLCDKNYKKNDFHTMYIGEITKVLVDNK